MKRFFRNILFLWLIYSAVWAGQKGYVLIKEFSGYATPYVMKHIPEGANPNGDALGAWMATLQVLVFVAPVILGICYAVWLLFNRLATKFYRLLFSTDEFH